MASYEGYKLTYTKNPSSPSSLKIFPMELSTPLRRKQDRDRGHPQKPTRTPPPLLRAIQSWPGWAGETPSYRQNPSGEDFRELLFGGEGPCTQFTESREIQLPSGKDTSSSLSLFSVGLNLGMNLSVQAAAKATGPSPAWP